MPAVLTKTTVSGGKIVRSAKSGRFVSVESETGVYKSTPKTRSLVQEISEKRRDALKRLADR
jgi:hypothetical protein